MLRYVTQTVREFIDDDCPTMAAALAYYTIFALPPLLYIIILIAGQVAGQEAVQAAIQQQAQEAIGGNAGRQVATMIEQASRPSTGGIIGLWLSVFGVILGATSAFGQLQAALNRAWEVRAQSGVLGFVIKRLLSLGMVIGIAILVLASLVLNTWVSTAGSHFGVPSWAMTAASFLLAFAILYVLFGAIFKYLPDAEVDWDDVKVGAFITALLYVIGKIALGIYLGRAGAASPYGAAGALALILLFIYYSAMLLLLGAEFTQVWATHHGKEIRPSRGAGRLSEAA